jgi:hypothetical protein
MVYVAYGAVIRPAGPAHGKAGPEFALADPLRLAVAGGASTTTTHINNTHVTSVTCMHSNGTSAPCGSQSAGDWTITNNTDDPRVAVVASIARPR